MPIKVSISNDSLGSIKQIIESIARKDVLVGVSENDNPRNEESIGSAQLLFIHTNGVRTQAMRIEMEQNVKSKGYHAAYNMYIHSHGSPIWSIPPRPVIEPAIEADKKVMGDLLKDVIMAGLNGDLALAEENLRKVGIEGQTVSQEYFTNPNNGWAKNSPLTIKKKGSSNPLIDTGALRQSIQWSIRGDKNA